MSYMKDAQGNIVKKPLFNMKKRITKEDLEPPTPTEEQRMPAWREEHQLMLENQGVISNNQKEIYRALALISDTLQAIMIKMQEEDADEEEDDEPREQPAPKNRRRKKT